MRRWTELVSFFLILLVNISLISFVNSDQTTCYIRKLTILVSSSPELKARELFWSPVVRLSVRISVRLKTFHISIFFSRTTGSISTNVCTKEPLVKQNQVCSNLELRPFLRGDNYEIAKIHWQNFEIFSRSIWQIATILGTKHRLVTDTQGCTRGFKLSKRRWVFTLQINVMIWPW